MLKIKPGPWAWAVVVYGPVLAMSTVLPILFLAPIILVLVSGAGLDSLWRDFVGGGMSLLGGFLGLIQGALRVHTIWFKKAMPVALLANSRTLAIHHYRGRTRYIKFRECVGLREGPPVVVLENGEQVQIGCEGVKFRRLERDFLDPLYAWWWPHVSRTQVQAWLAANQRLPIIFLATVSGVLPILGIALFAALTTGRLWLAAGGFALLLFLSLRLVKAIRRAAKERYLTIFPLYENETALDYVEEPCPEPADS